eukprot:TRINITY_DN26859_c0_g1_i1.p1 TRINITY_DN26859_c0_g1~~TRINITY_DN26859_c0_g1_i1.p1  ORF type:complete len:1210 (-),score=183.63 TRINITY_DN26859_c0_g1_i1:21-3650(-)
MAQIKLMPKVPLNGPEGKVNSDILVGRAGEFEIRVPKARANIPLQYPSLVPKSARLRRRFPLPQLSEMPQENAAKSARGHDIGDNSNHYVEGASLDMHLARKDQFIRLPGLPPDGLEPEPPRARQPDGERPTEEALVLLGVPEHTAAAISLGSTSSKSLFSLSSAVSIGSSSFNSTALLPPLQKKHKVWLSAASLHVRPHGTQQDEQTLRRLQKTQSVQSTLSETIVIGGESEPWIIDRMQMCFQRSPKEIKDHLADIEAILRRNQTDDQFEGQDSNDDNINLSLRRAELLLKQKELKAKHAKAVKAADAEVGPSLLQDLRQLSGARDRSNIEAWALQPPGFASIQTAGEEVVGSTASPSLSNQTKASPNDGDDVRPLEDEIAKATEQEIFRSGALLGFARWICGLPPVNANMHLHNACGLLCEVLLPRQQPATFRPAKPGDGRGLPDFGQAMTDFLEQHPGAMSVLHNEGSLLDAVEQGIFALRAKPWPPFEPPQPAHRFATAQKLQSQASRRRAAEREHFHERLLERQGKDISIRDRVHANHAVQVQPSPPVEIKRRTLKERQQVVDVVTPRAVEAEVLRPLLPFLRHGQEPLPREADAAEVPRLMCDTDTTAAKRGDPDGHLVIRRRLLSPLLRGFGACRQRDTCVLWTDDTDLRTSEVQGCLAFTLGAVCYPPAGWVPASLVCGWQTPWTIMPDSTKYGPTAATTIHIWRVQFDFSESNIPLGAERISEVPAKGFSIDCAAHGEPFCVFFWPDISELGTNQNLGLEVRLGGLRGPETELTFYYQVAPFRQDDMRLRMITEAKRLRCIACEPSYWIGSNESIRKREELTKQLVRARTGGLTANTVECLIQPMSHHKNDLHIDGLDLMMTVRAWVPSLRVELYIVRFGGDEDIVPRGVQCQKLPNWNFIIRAKLPLPRVNYELRFFPEPNKASTPPLRYYISVNDAARMPALLTSLDDPLTSKFGYAPLNLTAQRHGVILLSPLMYRITVGTVYFLLYVDKAAISDSTGSAEPVSGSRSRLQSMNELPSPRGESFSGRKSQVQLMNEPSGSSQGQAEDSPRSTSLFTSRLGLDELPQADKNRSMLGTDWARLKVGTKESKMYSQLGAIQAQIRPLLGAHVQDSPGEVHFDISAGSGSCVRRLRERPDMPGYFEGFLTFERIHVQSKVTLFMRLPAVDSKQYAPRVLCEWLVCRSHGEPVPKGFADPL